jgi:hypothetical protein
METTTLVASQETKSNGTGTVPQTEQKDAVFALALRALGSKHATGQPLKSLVTKEVRKAIRVGLYEGIKDGTIKYSKAGKSDGQLKKYCSSLINNWLKKDPRFN